MSTPVQVRFSDDELAWIDAQRGEWDASRSGVIRRAVREAIRKDSASDSGPVRVVENLVVMNATPPEPVMAMWEAKAALPKQPRKARPAQRKKMAKPDSLKDVVSTEPVTGTTPPDILPSLVDAAGTLCGHSKASWQSFPWGTICGDCKARLR